MKVKEQELKIFLEKASSRIEVDPDRRGQSIKEVTEQMMHTRLINKQSFMTILIAQTAYISPFTWGAECFILMVTLYFSTTINFDVGYIVEMAIIAPFIALVGCSEFSRSFSSEMWELEEVTRYGLKKLMGMKFLIIGCIDLILISVISIILGSQYHNTEMVGSMMLLFFNLSTAINLLLMKLLDKKCTNLVLFTASLLMSYLFMESSVKVMINVKVCRLIYKTSLLYGVTGISCILLIIVMLLFLLRVDRRHDKKWSFI